jgi:hypothetical protein
MDQPYYVVDFSASSCRFEIRVNDLSVITINLDGQAATMVPINHAIIQSGKQEISASVLPLLGEMALSAGAQLKFDIKVFDVSHDFLFKESFATFVTTPVDESKKIPAIIHQDTFMAKVPYTLNAWQNGQELKNSEILVNQVKRACGNIQEMLKNKQYDNFKLKMSPHEKNMATALYLSDVEEKKRLDELVSDFQSGFEVMPVPENAILQIYCKGKLVTLKRPNGDSALYLYNKETEEELMLDINFYLPLGKTQLEII